MIFEDVGGQLMRLQSNFTDTVADDFGSSINENIFAPLKQEVAALLKMEEEFHQKSAEMDTLMEEIRSIRPMRHY